MEDEEGWEVWLDSQQQQLKIEAKTSAAGNLVVRARGPVDWCPRDILKCSHQKDTVKYIEENLESCDIIRKHEKNLFIIERKTTKTLILPPTDTILNALVNEEEDGSIYQVATSNAASRGFFDVILSGKYYEADPDARDDMDYTSYVTVIFEYKVKDGLHIPLSVQKVLYKHKAC